MGEQLVGRSDSAFFWPPYVRRWLPPCFVPSFLLERPSCLAAHLLTSGGQQVAAVRRHFLNKAQLGTHSEIVYDERTYARIFQY